VGLARGGNWLTWELRSEEAWLPYLLMFYGALTWAFYTNLSRRWLGKNTFSGLPLFILAMGVVLAWMCLFTVEFSQWSLPAGLHVAYLVIGVTWMTYTFWDIGSRRGNLILLGTLSYFIPLISTGVSVIVLGEAAKPTLWLAAVLLISGAWVCQRSVRDTMNETRLA
jgi:drug/metabolite transporter (DMT)-like permease